MLCSAVATYADIDIFKATVTFIVPGEYGLLAIGVRLEFEGLSRCDISQKEKADVVAVCVQTVVLLQRVVAELYPKIQREEGSATFHDTESVTVGIQDGCIIIVVCNFDECRYGRWCRGIRTLTAATATATGA
jgi:hypothetical protein